MISSALYEFPFLIFLRINTNSNSCSNKKSKYDKSPAFSTAVDVPKRNFADNLPWLFTAKNHQIKVSTGCINEIENCKVA